jgi:hypothetical protein
MPAGTGDPGQGIDVTVSLDGDVTEFSCQNFQITAINIQITADQATDPHDAIDN